MNRPRKIRQTVANRPAHPSAVPKAKWPARCPLGAGCGLIGTQFHRHGQPKNRALVASFIFFGHFSADSHANIGGANQLAELSLKARTQKLCHPALATVGFRPVIHEMNHQRESQYLMHAAQEEYAIQTGAMPIKHLRLKSAHSSEELRRWVNSVKDVPTTQEAMERAPARAGQTTSQRYLR